MSAGKLRVNVFDLVAAIARVVDMMSPAVGSHHMQVAYLAYRLSEELNLPADKRYELFIAGALHDIGAFSLQERIDLLEFEDAKPGQQKSSNRLLPLPNSYNFIMYPGKTDRVPFTRVSRFLWAVISCIWRIVPRLKYPKTNPSWVKFEEFVTLFPC